MVSQKRLEVIMFLLLFGGIGCGGGGGSSSQSVPPHKATAISAGGEFSVALLNDNTVLSWGANYRGQLGDNTTIERYSPTLVTGADGHGELTDVVSISCGATHSLALTRGGTLWAWGDNFFGQLGINSTNNRYSPVQVLGIGGIGLLDNVVALSASVGMYSLALGRDGTVAAWGANPGGNLGDGTGINRHVPVKVKGLGGVGELAGIVRIATGNAHSLAVSTDNTVWTWGSNDSGQLGDNTYNTSFTPLQVYDHQGAGVLTGVAEIAGGNRHSIALANSGTVWGWGLNSFGQVGDNTNLSRTLPVQIKEMSGNNPLTDVVAISCGLWHTLALRRDGTVLAWGYNTNGQLGNNSTIDSASPVQVLGEDGNGVLSDVVAVSAGWYHSIALKKDGSVLAWGLNDHGQLGDDSNVRRLCPKKVKGF